MFYSILFAFLFHVAVLTYNINYSQSAIIAKQQANCWSGSHGTKQLKPSLLHLG